MDIIPDGGPFFLSKIIVDRGVDIFGGTSMYKLADNTVPPSQVIYCLFLCFLPQTPFC